MCHFARRHSAVDVVVLALCGERAGEVLETILDFTKMEDPRTGGDTFRRALEMIPGRALLLTVGWQGPFQ